MYLIFGWGKQTYAFKSIVGPYECPSCHSRADFELGTRRTWFTLLLLPIVPYESHEVSRCKSCSTSYSMTQSTLDLALKGLAPPFPQTGLVKSNFSHKGERVRCPNCLGQFYLNDGESSSQICPLCKSEVQIMVGSPKSSSINHKPVTEQVVRVRCPNTFCNANLNIPAGMTGEGSCPKCNAKFDIASLFDANSNKNHPT